MGISKQVGKIQADAEDPAVEMPLDDLNIRSDNVIFLFQGDNGEHLELVGGEDQDSGFEIQAGERYFSGPHQWQNAGASKWLFRATGSGTDTVTVKVVETYASGTASHGPVSDDVDIDQINAAIEAVYNSTLPNPSDGDNVDFQADSRGRLITELSKALASNAIESLHTIEQEVPETFLRTLLGSGLGPQKYVGDPPAAEHTISSNPARLYQVSGFVPDQQGNGNENFLQIWDGDPSGSGSFVESVPFTATGSGADRFPPFSSIHGEDLPGGAYVVFSQDPITYNPVSYDGYVFARYED